MGRTPGRADVLVVGAGAAGAVLAARLSEDPDRSVLLIDTGEIPCGEAEFGRELLDARLVPGPGSTAAASSGPGVPTSTAGPPPTRYVGSRPDRREKSSDLWDPVSLHSPRDAHSGRVRAMTRTDE